MQRNASEAERMSDINMIDSITASLTERSPKRDASIRFTLMPVQRAKLSVSHHGSSWSGMSNPFLVVKVATSDERNAANSSPAIVASRREV